MKGIISSRTPEGEPDQCPLCGARVHVEPSQPTGDAPCPHCGHLLWFSRSAAGTQVFDYQDVSPYWEQVANVISESLGISEKQITGGTSFSADIGADSLDL